MANMSKSTSGWVGSSTQSAQSKTYTFPTASKYVDKNINLTVNVAGGSIGSTSGNVVASNATLSTSNTSGISVTGSGKGVVTSSGWVNNGATAASASSSTKYITGVSLPKGKSFSINDGINNWTFSVDANGNVTIT